MTTYLNNDGPEAQSKTWRFFIMADKSMIKKPLAAAVGVAFVTSMAAATIAVADSNPFEAAELDTGYMLAGEKGKEGKCGEGKCGGEKGEEGSCGEDKGEEGSCGADKGEEGSCGADKGEEGSCGADKGEEGKCGEGKCGGEDGSSAEHKGEEGKCGGAS